MAALQEIGIGIEYRIVEVQGSCPTAKRLRELGMIPGAVCRVVRRAPFGGPMEVALEHRTLGIRFEKGLSVIVEPLPMEQPASTFDLVGSDAEKPAGVMIDNMAA